VFTLLGLDVVVGFEVCELELFDDVPDPEPEVVVCFCGVAVLEPLTAAVTALATAVTFFIAEITDEPEIALVPIDDIVMHFL
jgi:hypothetical protein